MEVGGPLEIPGGPRWESLPYIICNTFQNRVAPLRLTFDTAFNSETFIVENCFHAQYTHLPKNVPCEKASKQLNFKKKTDLPFRTECALRPFWFYVSAISIAWFRTGHDKKWEKTNQKRRCPDYGHSCLQSNKNYL